MSDAITIDATLQQAVLNHQAGHLQEAQHLYHSILNVQPQHSDANHNLGVLAIQMGKPEQALPRFKIALETNPTVGQFWFSYINALILTGHKDNARQILTLGKRHGLQNKIIDELEAKLASPSHEEISTLTKLFEQRSLTEMESLARSLTERFPLHEIGWKALGVTLQLQERSSEALFPMQKAVEILPGDADAHNNLGVILRNLNQLTEAEAHYRRALEINPAYADAYSNLAWCLTETGRYEDAILYCQKALAITPDNAGAHVNLGNLLKELWRPVEAGQCYKQALKIAPNLLKARDNLLNLIVQNPQYTPSYHIEEARKYGQIVTKKVSKRFYAWKCSNKPKRLRIGLVSGDFLNHPVGYFLENLLFHLAQAQLELIAYPTHHKEDELTARIKPNFTDWKPLFGLTDEAAATLIYNDAVHILLDLSGHTFPNRLPVFAWKPAPIQASWLGDFATTGVDEIDYLIADEVSAPVSHQHHFTETIWHLPDTRLCFTAPDFEMSVQPLPAQTNDYITFGCFQRLCKVGDNVLEVWSKIFSSLPNAKLRFQCKQLDDSAMQKLFLKRLRQHGIDSERVNMFGSTSRSDYLAAHSKIDAILDTFPYTGGTTTCEALWMGVPTLTLKGSTLLSRQGASLLTAANLSEWIAENEAEYITKAVEIAGDLSKLATLRSNLRQQVMASPIFDAPRFAQNFETALWKMWQKWHNSQNHSNC